MKTLGWILLVMIGCGAALQVKDDTVAIDTCMERATAFIFSEHTCAAAQAKIDQLQATDLDCQRGFGTRRIDACKLIDGGANDN